MKARSVSRLSVALRLALPVGGSGLLLWCGISAALAGLGGTVAAPLALAAVALCALGIGSCGLWAAALIRDLRRPLSPPRQPL